MSTTQIEMVKKATIRNRNALKLQEGFERVQLDALVNPATGQLHIPALKLWYVQPSIERKPIEDVIPLEFPVTPDYIPLREPMCTPRRLDMVPVLGSMTRRIERSVPIRRMYASNTQEQPRPHRPAPVARQALPLIPPRTRSNSGLWQWLLALAVLVAWAGLVLVVLANPRLATMTAAPSQPATGLGGPTAGRWVYDTCPNSMSVQLSFPKGTDIIGNLDGKIREVFSAQKAGIVSRDLHALCANGPDGDWVPVVLEGENVYMRESSLTAFPWDVSSKDSED